MTVVEIAAALLADLVARTAALDLPLDEVVLGNCLGPGGNVARVSALAAGLGESVPAVTIDRQCASGLEAVVVAARAVGAGDAALVLAGGAESASTAPWRCWPPRPGEQPRPYRRAPFAPPGFPDPDMGAAADDLAERLGISRRAQDDYAALSHGHAAAAAAAGDFDAELLPLPGLQPDERPRDGLTEGRLSRLPAAFSADGTATAGNSSGISDGAAAVAVTTADRARRAGLPAIRILAAAATRGRPGPPRRVRRPGRPKGVAARGHHRREVGCDGDHRSLRLRCRRLHRRPRAGSRPGVRAGRRHRAGSPLGRVRRCAAGPTVHPIACIGRAPVRPRRLRERRRSRHVHGARAGRVTADDEHHRIGPRTKNPDRAPRKSAGSSAG